MSESKLIFIMLKGADLVKAVKPELEMAIKKGAKVYCVSGSYYDEHEEMGIKVDKQMLNYFSEGGLENMKNMILYALKKDCSFNVSFNPPIEYPHLGIYDSKTRKIFRDFEEYKKAYTAYRAGNPWIGYIFLNITLAQERTSTLTPSSATWKARVSMSCRFTGRWQRP